MKKYYLFLLVYILSLLLSGCQLFPAANQNQPVAVNNLNQFATPPVSILPTSTEINYYLSTENSLKYCDGNNMDSVGFRKTITQKTTAQFPAELNFKERLFKTLELADQAAEYNLPYEDTNYIKIIGDAALMAPIGGWAGVSIFLCSWQPFVEVNLLQFPEIHRVIWVNDLPEWAGLGDSADKTVISYLKSYDNKTIYCDGGDTPEKQSAIYKATLTQRVIKIIDQKNLSNEELIRQTLQISGEDTQLSPYSADDQNFLKIKGDTAYFNRPDGFAGLWHQMCLYQPFAEVNLKQFSEIKNVVWTQSQQEWDNIK